MILHVSAAISGTIPSLKKGDVVQSNRRIEQSGGKLEISHVRAEHLSKLVLQALTLRGSGAMHEKASRLGPFCQNAETGRCLMPAAASAHQICILLSVASSKHMILMRCGTNI